MLQGSAERPEQGHSGCGKELLVRVGDEGSPRRSVSATTARVGAGAGSSSAAAALTTTAAWRLRGVSGSSSPPPPSPAPYSTTQRAAMPKHQTALAGGMGKQMMATVHGLLLCLLPNQK